MCYQKVINPTLNAGAVRENTVNSLSAAATAAAT